MRRAIHFDDQPTRQAREIGDVISYRMLPSKFVATDSLPARAGPEDDLRIGHSPSQVFRESSSTYFVTSHAQAPSVSPLRGAPPPP
jgi:hypothetical protein